MQKKQTNPFYANYGILILQIIFLIVNGWVVLDIISKKHWDQWFFLMLCLACIPLSLKFAYLSLMSILEKPKIDENDFIESSDAKFYKIILSPSSSISWVLIAFLTIFCSIFTTRFVVTKLNIQSATSFGLIWVPVFLSINYIINLAIHNFAYVRIRPFTSKFLCPSCNWPVLTEDYLHCSCNSWVNPFLNSGRCDACGREFRAITCPRCSKEFPFQDWHEKARWGELSKIYDQLTSVSNLMKEKKLKTYDSILKKYFNELPRLKVKIDTAIKAIQHFKKAEVISELEDTKQKLAISKKDGAKEILNEKITILSSTLSRISNLEDTLELYQLKQDSFVASLKNLELQIVQDSFVSEDDIKSISNNLNEINKVFEVFEQNGISI